MSKIKGIQIKKIITLASAISFVLTTASPSLSANYDAICGDVDCQIGVSARGISGPGGFMPAGLVSIWNVGKASDFNMGKGVAGGLGGATAGVIGGALLLGPIGAIAGLIGGAAAGSDAGKEFEGYFSIVGYNKSGEKISHSFYFINPKPVKRLLSELPLFTGLMQNEERPLEEIEQSFTSGEMMPKSNDSLPTKLGGSSKSSNKLSAQKCWSDYLKTNPAMAVWADYNPTLAEKKRIESGYENCD